MFVELNSMAQMAEITLPTKFQGDWSRNKRLVAF